MIALYNSIIRGTTAKNIKAMTLLQQLAKEFPEVTINDPEGLQVFLELKHQLEIEEAQKEAEAKGKSEGIVKGRIEAAYKMIHKKGMSFEDASDTLELTEIEQSMLRQRMGQNGH
jgi:flagellar biosynthesis/type III secretory pathway protein FliH